MSARACAVAAVTASAALSGCGAGHAAARAASPGSSPSPRGSVRRVAYFSPALGRRRSYDVYLPPDYAAQAAAGRRYPVLYLLHSAPGWPARFFSAGHLASIMDRGIAARTVQPTLLVAPYGRVHLRPGGPDTEWANTHLGRYEDVVLDTVRAVDRRWSVARSRRDRWLAGVSTGGYGAANVALHHLATFGGFESWSGYFVQTRADAFATEPAASLRRNSPLDYVAALAGVIARHPVVGLAYRGTKDHEASGMDAFIRGLRRAGGTAVARHPAGGHGWTLWVAQAPAMLRFASAHMPHPVARR